MTETRLAERRSAGSEPETDTGHMATSGCSGSSKRSSRKRRIDPAHTASTTSFIVTSKLAATPFISSSGRCVTENDRCCDSEPFHGATAPDRGSAPGSSRRRRCTAWAAATVVRVARGATRAAARRARPTAARARCCQPAGRGSWRSSTGSGTASDDSASRSNRWASASAPPTPSMAQWWTLITSPMRLSASPSTTHTSHSGRLRSSGVEASSPTTVARAASSPGAGQVVACMWASMSVSVSTQTGRPSDQGAAASRRRMRGTRCRRCREVTLEPVERVATGMPAGSRTITSDTCRCWLGVSR